jgi:hypothetical protein
VVFLTSCLSYDEPDLELIYLSWHHSNMWDIHAHVFQHWAGCLPCFHGWHEPFATVFYKPEADRLHVFVNAPVQLNLCPMMIWCMIIASHVSSECRTHPWSSFQARTWWLRCFHDSHVPIQLLLRPQKILLYILANFFLSFCFVLKEQWPGM